MYFFSALLTPSSWQAAETEHIVCNLAVSKTRGPSHVHKSE